VDDLGHRPGELDVDQGLVALPRVCADEGELGVGELARTMRISDGT